MTTPEPTIAGELEQTPFLHIMVNLHQRALTGTLAIWPESEAKGQDRVYFLEGTPVTARLLASTSPVLDRGLLPLFGRRAGAFAFYEGQDLVGEGGLRGRVIPLALLATALRIGVNEAAMNVVLEQYRDSTLRLRSGLDLKRYGLLSKEERLIEVVRAGPASIEELVGTSELGADLGRRLVYLLLITRALEPYVSASTSSNPPPVTPRPSISPGQVSSPPMASRTGGGSHAAVDAGPSAAHHSQLPLPPSGRPSGRPSTPSRDELPPQGLSADALAFFVEAKQRVKQLETQNYFEMLNVPRDVGADTIRKTFLQLAKRWHPDRLPPELQGLRADAEDIFRWLTTAHDTLVDDQKRAEHLRAVQDGGGTPEADRKLAAIMTAAMEHQKAEVLIKRRDFAGARSLLERALELGTEDADLHATYAWVLFNVPTSDALLNEILRHLDRALAIAPNHDRAHFYRALTSRRMGREENAIKHFKLASEANPKNLDAQREVRLARMRGQLGGGEAPKDEPKPKDEGFLSKLFGSSKKK